MLLSTPLSLLAFATLAAAQSSSSSTNGTRSASSTRSAKSVVHNSTATTTVADAADTLTISGAASTVTFADSVPSGAPAAGANTGNGGVLGGNPDDGDSIGFTFPTNASWWVLGAPAKQPNTLQLHFAANITALRIFLTNSDTSLLKRTLQIKTVLKPADGTTTFTLDTARPLWGAQPGKGFVLVAQFNDARELPSIRERGARRRHCQSRTLTHCPQPRSRRSRLSSRQTDPRRPTRPDTRRRQTTRCTPRTSRAAAGVSRRVCWPLRESWLL